jgi:hypothetical protein
MFFAEHGRVWYFAGFPTYGGGPFEAIGIPTSVPLLAGFVTVCAAEVALGAWMWTGRRSSLMLSSALLPFEVAYWLGFALPGGFALGAARAAIRHRAARRVNPAEASASHRRTFRSAGSGPARR